MFHGLHHFHASIPLAAFLPFSARRRNLNLYPRLRRIKKQPYVLQMRWARFENHYSQGFPSGETVPCSFSHSFSIALIEPVSTLAA